jgi:hypothetical protein
MSSTTGKALAGAIGVLTCGVALAQSDGLRTQDYIDIEQLAARYIHLVELCTNGGYEDVYVRTDGGWRLQSRVHVFPNIGESVQFGGGADAED